MKLYAVIHTTGGFAREDAAQPAITGIYQDPEVAEVEYPAHHIDQESIPG